MWKPDKSKRFPFDLTIIDSDYEDLLFYDYPVLFTGRNNLEDRIIGSFVEHQKTYEAYLHSLVEEATYVSFINQRISYPEVLQQAELICLMHWTGGEKPVIYAVTYNDIPVKYRPDARAFCPPTVELPALDYEVKFKGGLAEKHQATPETLGKFHPKMSKVIKQPFDLKGLKEYNPDVLVQASAPSNEVYAQSSLKVNYHIKFEEKAQQSFFDASADSLIFLESYLTYCLNDLSSDLPHLRSDNIEELPRFKDLWSKYQKLIPSQNSDAALSELINNLGKIAIRIGEISQMVGDEFKETVLSSISASEVHALGILNSGLGVKFEEAIQEVAIKSGKDVVTDAEPTKYVIHIYDLNTDTRNGRALTAHLRDRKTISKPTIHILGSDHLTQTKYTESLHLDKYIDVLAVGTIVDGNVTRLDIQYEPEEVNASSNT